MRVAAFDPGGRYTGYALLDVGPGLQRFIKGGVSERGDMFAIGFFMAEQIDLVAVESVRAMYGRARFGVSMANAIRGATRIEERILAAARNAGIPSAICTAADWRRALLGKRPQVGTADAAIKRALSLRLELPKRSSCHMRDAVGCGLFLAQKHKIERMKRAV